MIDSKYYELSLKRVIDQAGARYQNDTNVELPLLKHFDYFTRSPDVYTNLRKIYGDLKRSLDSLKIFKQPGVENIPYSFTLNLSDGLSAINLPNGAKTIDKKIIFSKDLKRDIELNIALAK